MACLHSWLAWISTARNSPKIQAHRRQCLTPSIEAALRSTREPSEGMALHQLDGLLKDAWEPVLPGRHIQFDGAPRGARDERDLLAQLGGPAAQGDERDPQVIQPPQVAVGRQAGVED